jgi:hypothetical protein
MKMKIMVALGLLIGSTGAFAQQSGYEVLNKADSLEFQNAVNNYYQTQDWVCTKAIKIKIDGTQDTATGALCMRSPDIGGVLHCRNNTTGSLAAGINAAYQLSFDVRLDQQLIALIKEKCSGG